MNAYSTIPSKHGRYPQRSQDVLILLNCRREFDDVVRTFFRARISAKKTREHAVGTIHDKTPRETVGRETTNRFRMQFQAAAFAALEILSGKDVERVYCDYHDDFVVRRNAGGSVEYHFC